jgi:predicted DNA-binding transcriptional regulator YafY
MRADRLLSLLMLLQARGRMTARELARELEVSERTIYRDLDALSAAGVPVYAARGPGGGCALLDSYRTTLTGLTQDEVRALFTLSIPAPLADLGLDEQVRAALLKLAAALPDSRRHDEAGARQRVYLDPASWSSGAAPAPHLQTTYRALWAGRCLRLVIRLPFDTEADAIVQPLGLVAKDDQWYLVCRRNGYEHVYRMADVVGAEILSTESQRPATFDLAAFWRRWCAWVKASRPEYRVRVRAAPRHLKWIAHQVGSGAGGDLTASEPPDADGQVTLELTFESLEHARSRLLACGRAVEVLAPRALRDGLADFADQIAALYAPAHKNGP